MIGDALNKSLLAEEGISFEPDYNIGGIVFCQGNSEDYYLASLLCGESEGGIYRYTFQVEVFHGNGSASVRDVYGVNILLTAIERAFYQLDNNTEVQRTDAKFHSDVKF